MVTTLEAALAHALARPDCLAPVCSSLELHTGPEAYALLTTALPDGTATLVFGDLNSESVDRLVTVAGSTLFAISQELAGKLPAEVDAMLKVEK